MFFFGMFLRIIRIGLEIDIRRNFMVWVHKVAMLYKNVTRFISRKGC